MLVEYFIIIQHVLSFDRNELDKQHAIHVFFE